MKKLLYMVCICLMTIGLAGCSKEGNKVSNSDNNVSDTIAVSDEKSGISDLEETEDYFSEYRDKGYEYENLNIISSTLNMADDGNVYNKVKWYDEEENNFYKAKFVYEEDMYLNDEGVWDIGERGVTGTPELLEDKISGTYELYQPLDGSGRGASSNRSMSEIKEIIYAKNSKWEEYEKGIYNDKITLKLNSALELEVSGTVYAGYSNRLDIKSTHNRGFWGHSAPTELQWTHTEGDYTFNSSTYKYESAHILFKEKTGEIFIIAWSGGKNDGEKTYTIFLLVKTE